MARGLAAFLGGFYEGGTRAGESFKGYMSGLSQRQKQQAEEEERRRKAEAEAADDESKRAYEESLSALDAEVRAAAAAKGNSLEPAEAEAIFKKYPQIKPKDRGYLFTEGQVARPMTMEEMQAFNKRMLGKDDSQTPEEKEAERLELEYKRLRNDKLKSGGVPNPEDPQDRIAAVQREISTIEARVIARDDELPTDQERQRLAMLKAELNQLMGAVPGFVGPWNYGVQPGAGTQAPPAPAPLAISAPSAKATQAKAATQAPKKRLVFDPVTGELR